MAAPQGTASLGGDKAAKDVTLEEAIFGAEVKPHLVHEAVRAELNARRAGTRGAKSRGLVAGGRAKPWRQKGTGRAAPGTIRAPQFTGGGVAFPPVMRSFEVKVNRKAGAPRCAARSRTTPRNGTLALLDARLVRRAVDEGGRGRCSRAGARTRRSLVVATEEEETLIKSFRNLAAPARHRPVRARGRAVVWARSLLVTRGALCRSSQGRAA